MHTLTFFTPTSTLLTSSQVSQLVILHEEAEQGRIVPDLGPPVEAVGAAVKNLVLVSVCMCVCVCVRSWRHTCLCVCVRMCIRGVARACVLVPGLFIQPVNHFHVPISAL